jgi:hypothetical protein
VCYLVPGRTLNCLTRGGVFKEMRALMKGLQRAHDTADFYGSWLTGTRPGFCVVGVWVGPC